MSSYDELIYTIFYTCISISYTYFYIMTDCVGSAVVSVADVRSNERLELFLRFLLFVYTHIHCFDMYWS